MDNVQHNTFVLKFTIYIHKTALEMCYLGGWDYVLTEFTWGMKSKTLNLPK
jgi:hypothetical protein